MKIDINMLDARCVRLIPGTERCVQIAAIADGETCVRWWSPHLLHGTCAAAIRHTTKDFPCVHRIIPVDPTTSMPVGKPRWTVACQKIDWARYAVDYAEAARAETQEIKL